MYDQFCRSIGTKFAPQVSENPGWVYPVYPLRWTSPTAIMRNQQLDWMRNFTAERQLPRVKNFTPQQFFWGKELVGNLNTLTAKVTWIFTTYFNFYSCLKLTCFGHTQTACTFARSLRIHRSSRIVAAMALPMQPVVPPQPVVLAAPGSPQSSQAGSVTRDT